jgi:hypothetical protein
MKNMNRDISNINRDIRIMNRNIRKMEIENRNKNINMSMAYVCKFIFMLSFFIFITSLMKICGIIIRFVPGTMDSYSFQNPIDIDQPFSFSQNLADFSCVKITCRIPMETLTVLKGSIIKKLYICEKYNCSVENKTTTCVCDKQSPKMLFGTN